MSEVNFGYVKLHKSRFDVAASLFSTALSRSSIPQKRMLAYLYIPVLRFVVVLLSSFSTSQVFRSLEIDRFSHPSLADVILNRSRLTHRSDLHSSSDASSAKGFAQRSLNLFDFAKLESTPPPSDFSLSSPRTKDLTAD